MTVEDTKAYLRLESGSEDAIVGQLVAGATALAERYLGAALIRREVVETLAPGAGWRRLRAAPVASITAVTGVDGAPLPSARYAVDIDAHGDGWVRGSGRLRVRYVAGLAVSAAEVPAPIAQGVIRLAAHLYENRDDAAAPPAAVAALWRPYRRLRLGGERRA